MVTSDIQFAFCTKPHSTNWLYSNLIVVMPDAINISDLIQLTALTFFLTPNIAKYSLIFFYFIPITNIFFIMQQPNIGSDCLQVPITQLYCRYVFFHEISQVFPKTSFPRLFITKSITKINFYLSIF